MTAGPRPFGAQVYRANLVIAGIRTAARALRSVASSVGRVPLDAADRERLETELSAVMATFEHWDEVLTATLEGRAPCLHDPPPTQSYNPRRKHDSGTFEKTAIAEDAT